MTDSKVCNTFADSFNQNYFLDLLPKGFDPLYQWFDTKRERKAFQNFVVCQQSFRADNKNQLALLQSAIIDLYNEDRAWKAVNYFGVAKPLRGVEKTISVKNKGRGSTGYITCSLILMSVDATSPEVPVKARDVMVDVLNVSPPDSFCYAVYEGYYTSTYSGGESMKILVRPGVYAKYGDFPDWSRGVSYYVRLYTWKITNESPGW
jgi:hypothetical protein